MKDRIKDYFAFTKKEQRGLIILLGLMLLSVSANIFMPYLVPERKYDITPFKREVEEFLACAEKTDSVTGTGKKETDKQSGFGADPPLAAFLSSPFSFDPNQIDGQTWKEMGMPERISGNILRYREKGGIIRDKDGFRKIYGMNDEIFSILSPYLLFPENRKYGNVNPDSSRKSSGPYNDKHVQSQSHDPLIIELNSADSATLLSLNGIGPSYAGRIIKYRERLGGYLKPEQLMEIRGMDSIRFNEIRNQLTADPLAIRKIDLNAVTFKDLLKHPYFEYYLVKAIFNYKDQIRRFDSVQQLMGITVMYEELYDKIVPYLEVK
jgi:competence protein ComEA